MFSFSASMNFLGKKKHKGLHSELSPDMNVIGAYRTSRDDSFGYNKSFSTEQMQQQMRATKSTNDLTKVRQVPVPTNLRHSNAEVSRDPRGATQEAQDPRTNAQHMKLVKQQEKEQKRLDRQLQAEQRAREKQARKEQLKQEKLAKRTEQSARQTKREEKPDRRLKKSVAPQPPTSAPAAHNSQQYPTNTLESSISRSSGPPPYSAVPKLEDLTPSETTGNVAYKKPQDNGSWDMVSEHRQQIKLATVKGDVKNKPTVMDLNYRFEIEQGTSNSDA